MSNPQRLKGNVVLYTDSKSVVLVLKSARIKSTAVQLVLDLIVKVKEACSFDIRWIRGHSGNEGQELADNLAKEAAREIQGMRVNEMTLKDVKHFVQCKTAKAWQTRWQNHKGAARKFIQVVNPNKMKYIKRCPRRILGLSFKPLLVTGYLAIISVNGKMMLIKHASAVWKKNWRQHGTYGVNALHYHP